MRAARFFALMRRTWSGDADPTHTHIYAPREMASVLHTIGFGRVRIRTGFKPIMRIGGNRLPFQAALPYPPLIGNGLVAFGWREASDNDLVVAALGIALPHMRPAAPPMQAR